MVDRFADFELDLELYQLRRGPRVIKLEPKAFDVLRYLVRHRDRVVSKDELLEKLWPGHFVSESVLPTHVRTLRRALGDDRTGRFIQTVHGRGYRFVASLEREAVAEAAPVPPPERGPFVGRARVLDTLGEALGGALRGRGATVLLLGEPGIGKTRTAEELAIRAAAAGARVLAGRSYEGEGSPAFWPWIQVLRASAAHRDPRLLEAELGAGAAEIVRLVPELGSGAAEPQSLAGDPGQARFRLFDAVASYLRRAAESQPLLVLLDDLHWADRSSLMLLRFVARELRDSRALLLGACRDTELRRGHPLSALLGELARDGCRRLRLHGLEREDVARYVEAVTRSPASEELVALLHDRTEGNPFFLAEMMRLLGPPEESAGARALRSGLPEGLREAIGRRLDGLSEACNRILAAAAVLGREFSVAALEALAAVPRESLLGLLEEASAHGILREEREAIGRYAFAHELVRETLYEEISVPARAALHRRAAEILEAAHREHLEPHVAQLAHHYFHAAAGGSIAEAVHYGRRAAQRALRQAAWEEAAAHQERVLEALGLATPIDEAARCEALLALADAHSRAGDRSRARERFAAAGAAARALGRPELLARAALGFGGRYEWNLAPDETLRELLEDALATQGESDGALRAALLARLSMTYPYCADLGERERLTREALAMARRVGARWALVQALVARGGLLPSTQDAAEWLAIGTELLESARAGVEEPLADLALYDPSWVGHLFRHAALLALGDLPAADRELAALSRLADASRQPYQRFDVCLARFGRAHAAGRFEEARGWVEAGRRVAERLNPTAQHVHHLLEFLLARECGPEWLPRAIAAMDDEVARRAIPFEVFGLTDPSIVDAANPAVIRAAILEQIPWLAPVTTAIVAYTRMLQGRDAEAREELLRLDCDEAILDADWVFVVSLAAEVAARLGHAESAKRIHALLEPHAAVNATHPNTHVLLGPVAYFLGILDATLGRPEHAVAHLEAAVARCAAMGAHAHGARAQIELARALESLGERDRARALRAEGLARARELGMGALLREGA